MKIVSATQDSGGDNFDANEEDDNDDEIDLICEGVERRVLLEVVELGPVLLPVENAGELELHLVLDLLQTDDLQHHDGDVDRDGVERCGVDRYYRGHLLVVTRLQRQQPFGGNSGVGLTNMGELGRKRSAKT